VLAVLTDEEVVRGYRSGGGHGGSRSCQGPSVIKQEVGGSEPRACSATLPGGRAEGVLFSPLTGACGESVLTVQESRWLRMAGGLCFSSR
jgi:hypothetical protein